MNSPPGVMAVAEMAQKILEIFDISRTSDLPRNILDSQTYKFCLFVLNQDLIYLWASPVSRNSAFQDWILGV